MQDHLRHGYVPLDIGASRRHHSGEQTFPTSTARTGHRPGRGKGMKASGDTHFSLAFLPFAPLDADGPLPLTREGLSTGSMDFTCADLKESASMPGMLLSVFTWLAMHVPCSVSSPRVRSALIACLCLEGETSLRGIGSTHAPNHVKLCHTDKNSRIAELSRTPHLRLATLTN